MKLLYLNTNGRIQNLSEYVRWYLCAYLWSIIVGLEIKAERVVINHTCAIYFPNHNIN